MSYIRVFDQRHRTIKLYVNNYNICSIRSQHIYIILNALPVTRPKLPLGYTVAVLGDTK